MKKLNISLIIILLNCAFVVRSYSVAESNYIEQYGIRWTFDKNISLDGEGDTYQYGQFINGDYWIKGPVNIIAISPESKITQEGDKDDEGNDYPAGTIINGSMINPAAARVQGFISSTLGNIPYDIQLNVARPDNKDLTPQNPLSIPVGSSLISTISRVYSTNGSSNWPSLKTAAVLTVLETAPVTGSFRPAYCGSDKDIKFNVSQIDYDVFQNHTSVSGVPAPYDVQDNFQRLWLVHGPSVGYTNIAPKDNMPAYGSLLLWYTSRAALALNMDYTNAEKQTLLIRYIQLGIDLYGVIQNGGRNIWISDGGHHAGRKLPILIAGRALHNEDMLSVAQKSGEYLYSQKAGGGSYGPGEKPPDYIAFAEDEQTFYVTQWHIDTTQGTYDYYFKNAGILPSPQWTPGNVNQTLTWSGWDINGGEYKLSRPFQPVDIGIPEFGHRHATYPATSVPAWESCGSYRGISDTYYPVIALVARMMGIKEIWNNDAFFDYADRRVLITGNANGVYGGQFTAVWNAYRADYGPLWTPGSIPVVQDPDNPGNPYLPSGTIPEKTELRILNNVLKTGAAYATVKLMLSESGNASVRIFDSKGREIITLLDGHKEAGEYNLPWDGTDAGGKRVGSGVYMVHMQAGSYKETKKIVVVK